MRWWWFNASLEGLWEVVVGLRENGQCGGCGSCFLEEGQYQDVIMLNYSLKHM